MKIREKYLQKQTKIFRSSRCTTLDRVSEKRRGVFYRGGEGWGGREGLQSVFRSECPLLAVKEKSDIRRMANDQNLQTKRCLLMLVHG